MSRGGFEEFAKLMRYYESSGRYDVVNRFGYLGAYQFGKPRLLDLGISIDGWGKHLPHLFKKAKVISKKEFLEDKELQDEIFRKHCEDLKRAIRRRYSHLFGTKKGGVLLTLSGMVAGAHLVGLGGLIKWLRGERVKDGNDVPVELYLKLFQGFDI